MTQKFELQSPRQVQDGEHLIQRTPGLRLPRDVQGKRRYMHQIMPRLTSLCLVRALETMLSDPAHVLHYSQPCCMNKWRVEMAALAVGEVMCLLDPLYDPIGNTRPKTPGQQLIVLGTWLWQQAKDEFRREAEDYAHEATDAADAADATVTEHQPLELQRSGDDFDQTDPFENAHITKVIGSDGEAVKVGWQSDLYLDQGLARTRTQSPLLRPPHRPPHRSLKSTPPPASQLLVMLRNLALHHPLYARALALAWDIPLAWVGLQDVVVSVKGERLLLAHVQCWSRAANLRVQARHAWGGHRVAQRGAQGRSHASGRNGLHTQSKQNKRSQPGKAD